eukprot:CAMPEP_0194400040 /NCGR_PEP_ID=MMETSP0174-20130528/126992_1 /TAXON_ID=216777 /ORGANISM="Proboscia alata, Strain PI-D3" /LENGTH=256 /DNA_ID=CAMNT_0039196509 /DNA_START=213 /DNA_END=980 /DNA_ORIENTATION=+
MNDHNDNDTYVYKGEDGERPPQTVGAIDYVANITSIKAQAMKWCCHIKAVIHPDSITAIEDQAYFGCDAIEHLRLSSSLQTIGEGIEDQAYFGCDSIEHLRLSSSLQTIGERSFNACPSITMLELPPTLHTIKREGFGRCHSLRSIVPQQKNETLFLKTIEEGAFCNCESLTSIPYFSMLERIGRGAFYRCESLTEVTLEPSIISAARDCFDNCDSLIALHCTYRTGVILPWAVTHVIIDPNTTHIHTSAFAGCDD